MEPHVVIIRNTITGAEGPGLPCQHGFITISDKGLPILVQTEDAEIIREC